MKSSLIILSIFIAGLLLGLTHLLPDLIIDNDFSMYALYALMFFVGVGIGADRSAFQVLKTSNVKIFLIPAGIVIGSLTGAAAVSFLIPDLNIKDSMAVGAGFGYYSLSSVLITQISGEALGVVALLSNVLREIITLVATPVFIKYFGKLAGIASGGVTTMDSTLPIITEHSGKEWAVIAVFSGVILTILVPFLIPFILEVL